MKLILHALRDFKHFGTEHSSRSSMLLKMILLIYYRNNTIIAIIFRDNPNFGNNKHAIV